MPSFEQILSSTQMWQVSLLLANANKALPQAAMDILGKPLNFALPAPQETTPQAPAQQTPAQHVPAQPMPTPK
jgi:hypothetical protein